MVDKKGILSRRGTKSYDFLVSRKADDEEEENDSHNGMLAVMLLALINDWPSSDTVGDGFRIMNLSWQNEMNFGSEI